MASAASASKDDEEPPQEFVCPITFMLMKDPVMDDEGNTYERAAITEWVRKHHQSPVTRSPLEESQLIPNRALKAMIERWGSNRTKFASKFGAAIASDKLCRQKSDDLNKLLSPLADEEPADSKSAKKVNTCKVAIRSMHDGRSVVSIIPPAKGGRVPVDVCCVIDVSGSMSSNATLKDTAGNTETHGLSILDIAKHSVRTIARSLTANDRLSIVSYSTKAVLVMSAQKMDPTGQTKAEAAVMALSAGGQTNLWQGLEFGLQDLSSSKIDGRLQTIMLLTDGMPNISPPRGEAAMLKRRREKTEKERGIIVNTFGFGYSLDTKLLRELAQTGMGSYAFIPDASLVGTMFVNALANTLVSIGTSARFALKCTNGARFQSKGNAQLRMQSTPEDMTDTSALVAVGTVQFGQQKDVYVALELPSGADPNKQYLEAELTYQHQLPGRMCTVKSDTFKSSKCDPLVEYSWCRLRLISAIFDAIDAVPDFDSANAIIAKAVKDIKAANAARNPKVNALLKDLLGQVKEALSRKDWYNKWGKHYLPSLALAHLRQQCNNFKDPGVQCYGGEDFATQRDLADEIFCKMPPPRASPVVRTQARTRGASRGASHYTAPAPSRAVNMSNYMNRGGGCFHGDSQVAMADGSYKKLKDVHAGDLLATRKGQPASRVQCVVKSVQTDGVADLVQLPGSHLMATPWHPVRKGNQWVFPIDVGKTKRVSCDAVYNLLLQDGCYAVMEGWDCVTLAHGLTGDVVGHSYYGSQDVVHDLMELDGWSNGLVVLHPDSVVTGRDPSTGRVISLVAAN